MKHTYKPTVAIKGSAVPFTRKRAAADLAYIAWLAERDSTAKPLNNSDREGITEMDTIEVKLVRTNFLRRHECHACGGCTEKVLVLAEAETPDGTFRVCEKCLKAGDIDERLEAHAANLVDEAALVRSVIGRVKVPTYAEWQAAELRNDVADFANIEVDQARDRKIETAPPEYPGERILTDDALYAEWLAKYRVDEEIVAHHDRMLKVLTPEQWHAIYAAAGDAGDNSELPF